jgi:hypothetical protein
MQKWIGATFEEIAERALRCSDRAFLAPETKPVSPAR